MTWTAVGLMTFSGVTVFPFLAVCTTLCVKGGNLARNGIIEYFTIATQKAHVIHAERNFFYQVTIGILGLKVMSGITLKSLAYLLKSKLH